MNFTNENGVLTVFLSGRIDSSNAEERENELNSVIGANSFEQIIIDAEGIEYISSAGLRMILRTRKNQPSLKITNVSSEVYEIFDMTGFTEMLPVEKAYRRLSVDGCTVIGKGAKGTVYRYDADTIIKVYKDADSLPAIKQERELARKAFVLGIPTAIPYDVVKVGESFGSVFELLDAQSYSALIAENPEKLDEYVAIYTDLLKKIHSTQVKKGDMADIKTFVLDWVRVDAPYLPENDAKKLTELITVAPDTLNILHCDYHTNNIMMQNGETLLIDMDTLSQGHPVFELANIYITYVGFGENDPSVVESFIGLPYDTAVKIWEKFLPLYLGTDDSARINEVEEKVKLISYTRLMRHTIRRGGMDTDEGRHVVNCCIENISKLLEKIETLDF